jgi:hypothetical protein
MFNNYAQLLASFLRPSPPLGSSCFQFCGVIVCVWESSSRKSNDSKSASAKVLQQKCLLAVAAWKKQQSNDQKKDGKRKCGNLMATTTMRNENCE